MKRTLDRKKVLELLRLVFQSCQNIEGKTIKLMPPNADGECSKGYQIHIEPNEEIMERCIKKITRKSNLATAKEGKTLIIFNPLVED